jgi:CHAD domain-containing protein
MRSPRYYALLDRLDALVADPPLTPAASEPAGDVLLGRVRHDWNRLKNRVKAVTDADDPADHAARLHDVRKAAKRARYAGEPMIALYGKRAKRFVKATKEIQTVLGGHQDGVVLQQQLRDLADGATADGDSAFTYGVLHARAERDAVDGATVFPKAWKY